MRIEEFSLEGNHGWPDLRAGSLVGNLNVFWGPTRSGKSTVAGFLGHVLYGRMPHASAATSAAGGLVPGPAAPPEGS